MDHSSCVSDRHWLYDHRHHRRNLHTVGRLQELFNSKRNDFVGSFGCIHVAAGDDGVLLYKNCLRTETQGNCYLKSIDLLLIALFIAIAPDKKRSAYQ